MSAPAEHRAVTPLFRVFGTAAAVARADARQLADHRDMDPAEHACFSALVPLTVVAALADWTGWPAAVPLAFLALTTVPLLVPLKHRGLQWLVWCAGGLAWAVIHRAATGFGGLLAHVWLGLAVLNLAAAAVLLWQAFMRISGRTGIACRILLIFAMHAAAVLVAAKAGWIWLAPAGLVIGGIFCAAVLRPGSRILGEMISTKDTGEILLTFDDGPDPHDTPRLLELLDRHDRKAVFFMIGEKVRTHPELAREVVNRGHEIGNHTETHPQRSFWCAGPWRTWREISRCQEAIREATGVTPRHFRAPVGHRNLFTHPVCRALGLDIMAWNRRGYDAVETDPAKVLRRIVPHLAAGDIVLLHEATPVCEAVAAGVLDHLNPPRR